MNLDERISKELSNPANWRDSDRGPQLNPEAIKQLISDVVAEMLPPRVDIDSRHNLYRQQGDEGIRQHVYDRAQNAVIDQIESNLKKVMSDEA
jgi:hypothetical protein